MNQMLRDLPGPEDGGERISTTEARQAVTGTNARYVLAISLSAILVVFAIIYAVFAW